MTTRHVVSAVLGFAIAAVLLGYAFSRGGVAAITQAFTEASLYALAPAVACEVIVQLARTWKWTAILRTRAPVKFRNVLSAVVLGGASTHLVPLRLDEVLRAGLLGRREGIPMATVLGTVALDRIFEVFILGLMLAAVALSGDLQPWMRAGAALMFAGFVVVVLGVLAFLRSEASLRPRLEADERSWVRRVGGALGALADGLRAFPRGKALAAAIAGAAIEWSAVVALYSWLLHAYGAGSGLAKGIVLSLGSAFAYAIPNVPGAFGSYEILQTTLIEAHTNMDAEAALAFALTGHAVLVVPITVAGVLVAIYEWRTWGGLETPSEPSV